MTQSRLLSFAVLASIVGAAAQLLGAAPAVQPTQGQRSVIEVTSTGPSSDQRAVISRIDSLIASGQLRLIDQRDDTLIPGRSHRRYQQTYAGLPVLGADVTVQHAGSQVVSAFGIIFEGLAIDAGPALSLSQATTILSSRGVSVLDGSAPLSILPTPDGAVTLVYTLRDHEGFITYVSATDATELLRINQFQTQAAVIPGTGGLGDEKKLSVTAQSGAHIARDSLRPPAIETFDLQGDPSRTLAVANGLSTVNNNDLARQSGDTWNDSAVVDAHVHAGWVYDYYYRRFQRRGLDNNDSRIHSLVNPVRLQDARNASPSTLSNFYMNAFYSRACRCMVYGAGVPPGVHPAFPAGLRNFATALDVVAHELTHAVTDASSRLVYANESGALNEAFSDIVGTSVEFFYHSQGAGAVRADYLLGEDLTPNGSATRSMSSPTQLGQPDHFAFRSAIGSLQFDGGGVHINSGIANNAFYLAIEGGTHRYSRQAVAGVGAANREQIERVFYRAFTTMLPSNSTFYLARVATLQSARDLYGAGGNVERAVGEAWSAVGVTSPAAALTTQFNPRSVPASAVACGGARPSFTFRVSVSEFQGVGFSVSGFSIYSVDAQGRQIRAAEQFSSGIFREWFDECQSPSVKIGARATACATLCGDLGGRTSGYATFIFSGVDDNGNPGSFQSDYIQLGLPASGAADPTELTDPTFTKMVRQ